jgi:hypothetical protein
VKTITRNPRAPHGNILTGSVIKSASQRKTHPASFSLVTECEGLNTIRTSRKKIDARTATMIIARLHARHTARVGVHSLKVN